MKNNFNFFIILSIWLIVILLLVNVKSDINDVNEFYSLEIDEGVNNLTINYSLQRIIHVSEIIYYNPEIEVISYQENDKTIGYVNIYGGIGKNFIIEQNKTYEIISSMQTNLVIPK